MTAAQIGPLALNADFSTVHYAQLGPHILAELGAAVCYGAE